MPKCKRSIPKSRYPDNYFNKKQLRKGTKVEMEHTTNRAVAEDIAKAHLLEGRNYYQLLDKMEKKLIKPRKPKFYPHIKAQKRK